jgi:acyl-CoA thioester hydrolase
MSDAFIPRYRFPIRIYWEDTDAGGVTYHSNYLKFYERARSEWLREKGVVQSELVRLYGVVFVVRAVSQQFYLPARMDDLCEVWLAPKQLGRASLTVRHQLRCEGKTLNSAEVELACVNSARFQPARIPAPIYEIFLREH